MVPEQELIEGLKLAVSAGAMIGVLVIGAVLASTIGG